MQSFHEEYKRATKSNVFNNLDLPCAQRNALPWHTLQFPKFFASEPDKYAILSVPTWQPYDLADVFFSLGRRFQNRCPVTFCSFIETVRFLKNSESWPFFISISEILGKHPQLSEIADFIALQKKYFQYTVLFSLLHRLYNALELLQHLFLNMHREEFDWLSQETLILMTKLYIDSHLLLIAKISQSDHRLFCDDAFQLDSFVNEDNPGDKNTICYPNRVISEFCLPDLSWSLTCIFSGKSSAGGVNENLSIIAQLFFLKTLVRKCSDRNLIKMLLKSFRRHPEIRTIMRMIICVSLLRNYKINEQDAAVVMRELNNSNFEDQRTSHRLYGSFSKRIAIFSLCDNEKTNNAQFDSWLFKNQDITKLIMKEFQMRLINRTLIYDEILSSVSQNWTKCKESIFVQCMEKLYDIPVDSKQLVQLNQAIALQHKSDLKTSIEKGMNEKGELWKLLLYDFVNVDPTNAKEIGEWEFDKHLTIADKEVVQAVVYHCMEIQKSDPPAPVQIPSEEAFTCLVKCKKCREQCGEIKRYLNGKNYEAQELALAILQCQENECKKCYSMCALFYIQWKFENIYGEIQLDSSTKRRNIATLRLKYLVPEWQPLKKCQRNSVYCDHHSSPHWMSTTVKKITPHCSSIFGLSLNGTCFDLLKERVRCCRDDHFFCSLKSMDMTGKIVALGNSRYALCSICAAIVHYHNNKITNDGVVCPYHEHKEEESFSVISSKFENFFVRHAQKGVTGLRQHEAWFCDRFTTPNKVEHWSNFEISVVPPKKIIREKTNSTNTSENSPFPGLSPINANNYIKKELQETDIEFSHATTDVFGSYVQKEWDIGTDNEKIDHDFKDENINEVTECNDEATQGRRASAKLNSFHNAISLCINCSKPLNEKQRNTVRLLDEKISKIIFVDFCQVDYKKFQDYCEKRPKSNEFKTLEEAKNSCFSRSMAKKRKLK